MGGKTRTFLASYAVSSTTLPAVAYPLFTSQASIMAAADKIAFFHNVLWVLAAVTA